MIYNLHIVALDKLMEETKERNIKLEEGLDDTNQS